MMHFFPTPYPDEILYSVLARYSVRCGIVSHQTIMESIFGKSSSRAVMEMPFILNVLISNLPVNCPYTADDLIYKHTLYPFFTAFLPEERAEEIKQLMLSDGGSKIYGKAGIIGSRIPLNQYLRFCPICFEEEQKLYGEGYWHRLHQIPFVMVCPVHKTLLYNSTVLVRGHNPQAYVPADSDNCIINESHDYRPDTIEKFILIAQDAKALLENQYPNKPFNWFAKQYLERFKELGYANVNGKVYWHQVTMDFIDFYGLEFLNAVCSNVEDKEQGRWLKEVTHSDAKAVYPVRHLMLARFLGIEIEELFIKELSYRPFGEGPWVCLNPAADHFLEPVVENLLIKYRRRNKNVNGFFSCSCGFEYMETVTKEQGERGKEQRRFVRVVKYGPVWEAKVWELLESGVSVQEIAVRLNADIKTVRRYISEEEQKKSKKLIERNSVASAEFEVKRQYHREKWLQILRENPDKGRLELRRLGKYTCTWLCRNDREWWEKNTPAKKFVQAYSNVDWETRDKEILQHVKQTVHEILESDERPQRISLRLIKTRSGLKSFDLQLDKLPLTKSFINSVIETPMDLHKRRIQWAIEKLNKEGKALTISNITVMTGVGNKYRKLVIEEIKKALEELGER
ncbi:TnsD family transposase [Pseudoclostridium thermosuccinogenes]|uniref:TnsD family transposase n=1 Tax=Clostridium thermosuccinogenes TaxID=84032 RepID=UPI002FDA194F